MTSSGISPLPAEARPYQGHRAGLVTLGSRRTRWLAADIGQRQFYRILDVLLAAGETAATTGTLAPQAAVPPGAIVVAFSTMLETEFALGRHGRGERLAGDPIGARRKSGTCACVRRRSVRILRRQSDITSVAQRASSAAQRREPGRASVDHCHYIRRGRAQLGSARRLSFSCQRASQCPSSSGSASRGAPAARAG